MNRISQAFEKPGAFIAFLTAGDPDIKTTTECIQKLYEAGTDLIEIGVPFSDPCAEGPVIEAADVRALKGGITTPEILELVKTVRDMGIDIPLVLMTYYNPVYKYGEDKFFKTLKENGGDGVIIPDMPYEESHSTREKAKEYDLTLINLVAPTSKERIKRIAQDSDGFLYVVSSMGTTGIRSEITTDIPSMIKEIRKASDVPTAVGFGISTPEQAKKMCESADGVIVGSAIVKIIAEHGKDSADKVYEYAKSMKEGAASAIKNPTD